MSLLRKLVVPLVIGALLVAAAFTMFGGEDRKQLTASFPRTVSVYEGSEVRILGVPVGQIDTVEPNGTTVTVTMSYDAEVQVPEEAKAVIISPSVVGDRFVQLTPAYSGGPVLEDGATLDTDRTSTPLELDEIYQSLDDLTVAVGPDGANSEGALSDLLISTADNFGGQGEQFNTTLKNLGKLTGTLDNNKEELFGTARELDRFVGTLANNDKVVRDFNDAMSSVSDLLAGERQELAASLDNLGTALGEVKRFVEDNKALLSKNIKGLNRVTKTLVKRRGELKEILNVAPLALNNLALTYNPQAGTLDTASNIDNGADLLVSDPGLLLCGVVGSTDSSGEVCDAIQTALPRTSPFGSPTVEDETFRMLLGVAR
ncbi:MCE family protein [Nocardioides donggukensis]|uniref:MCE family protein n=1 Tax=Nocardioides donggukensis TaxID=2774019 RepID=A0A927Q209_9ACTN|nr:MCE family protein [Nocardioides donggukensis]MBD8870737.1 MCE family protein [Nocardioides donggukensis]